MGGEEKVLENQDVDHDPGSTGKGFNREGLLAVLKGGGAGGGTTRTTPTHTPIPT